MLTLGWTTRLCLVTRSDNLTTPVQLTALWPTTIKSASQPTQPSYEHWTDTSHITINIHSCKEECEFTDNSKNYTCTLSIPLPLTRFVDSSFLGSFRVNTTRFAFLVGHAAALRSIKEADLPRRSNSSRHQAVSPLLWPGRHQSSREKILHRN